MKNALRKLLYPIVKPHSSTYQTIYRSLRSNPTTPSVEHLVDLYAQMVDDVFFIQVGANDGKGEEDPLYYHIRTKKWRGMLIEPLPGVFQELQKNHGHDQHLIFEQVAIAKEAGTQPFYYVDDENGRFPAWVTKLSSFDPSVPSEVLEKFPEATLSETSIHCNTIHALLEKHQIKSVNLLLIDTEGYDYEILKTIDWVKLKPEVLIFEHRHLSTVDHQAALMMIREQGYEVYMSPHDTVGLRHPGLIEAYGAHLQKTTTRENIKSN